MTEFFLEDIGLYSQLDFLPIYSVDDIIIVAIYQLTGEIVDYTTKKYKQHKFIYHTQQDIHKLLYQFTHKDYAQECSAKNAKNYSVIGVLFIILILLIIATPIYTILVPIKNEKVTTVKALIKSISRLDYPQDKLDVKLIVEENDLDVVGFINTKFDIIKVPHSLPQTKAKACNYALNFAKGEYVTIYDADDRPDVLQLLFRTIRT